jgi:hypothetical protein
VDPGALAADIKRRGLVRLGTPTAPSSLPWGTSFSLRHKDVNWDKSNRKWAAQVYQGGKQEYLGHFATEDEAKARRDFSLV